ncbi:MAG TPA: ROK family protein [Arachnia sp.]|nr:ROK family protein [Arachnia sp.]
MSVTERQARHRASTAAVLEYAWDSGAFGADHVIAALGMTRSTALSALDELIDVGLIDELTSSAGPAQRLGRPARRFELRGEAGLIVGLDAGGRRFTATAADLTGRILAREHLELTSFFELEEPDPATRRTAALQVIDAVLAAAGLGRNEVVAVGVGVPAPVDGFGASPTHPSGFWSYMNAGLHEALSAEFPVVRVENDAALAALAEGSLGEARGREHYVAMLSGLRLGSGVVLEGRLVRGAHGGVGELEGLAYVSGVGGTWGLGYLAEQWLRAQLGMGAIPAGHPWSGLSDGAITGEAVLSHARLSDPVARPLLEELGGTLGRICTVVSRFYDPEVIVVCGAIAGALDEVIEMAVAHMAGELELPPPAVLASRSGGDVVSLGAVSAARESAREIVLPLLTARRHAARDPGI